MNDKRTDERLAEEYARLQLEIHQQGNARLIAVDYLAGLREGRALERAEWEKEVGNAQQAATEYRQLYFEVKDKLEEKCEALRDALKQNQESARVEAGLRAKIVELEEMERQYWVGLDHLTALQSANSALLEENQKMREALEREIQRQEKDEGGAWNYLLEALAPTAEKQGGM
jgi:hypothetical protein